MTKELSILVEPLEPVVYLNKRPYCNWFPLVVMLLFLIAACGFLVQVKAVVSDLKAKVDGLKTENQRLANNLEALAISQLKAEVAELKSEVAALKEEDLHLWDEAWRHVAAMGLENHNERRRMLFEKYALVQKQFLRQGDVETKWLHGSFKQYRERVIRSRARDDGSKSY